MKRHILLLAISLFQITASCQIVKNYILNYHPDDFVYTFDADSCLFINSNDMDISFDEDSSSYALPYMDVNILIGANQQFNSFEYSATETELYAGVKLSKNSPLHLIGDYGNKYAIGVADKRILVDEVYNIIEYTGTHLIGGYKIINFRVCPFMYNPNNKKSTLTSNIQLTILLQENSTVRQSNHAIGKKGTIKSLIINDNEIDSLYGETVQNNSKGITERNYNDSIKYVIVIDSSMVSAFMPLVNWKRQKGVPTMIVSKQYISDNYQDSTLQLKMKRFLYDNYCQYGIKYALLGGGEEVIPSQKCYGEITSLGLVDENIPVDMFYSCFKGSFNWNGNQNSRVGEVNDSIDYYPDIVLTRLPVENKQDVSTIVHKILSYEKNPPIDDWNNTMLLAGDSISFRYDVGSVKRSDADLMSVFMYNDYIKDYWHGDVFRFFDTYTDFTRGANYNFVPENIQEQLSQGYPFVDVTTHGSTHCWCSEDISNDYNYFHAKSLVNNHPTIITTSACLTNAFDLSDCCLSESFMNNANSGVIAYLGCSRETAMTTYTNNHYELLRLNGPMLMNAKFYKRLFTGKDSLGTNSGNVVVDTKMDAFQLSQLQHYTSKRWILLGTNPLGDPEMPIYTEKPLRFTDIDCSYNSGTLIVNTNIDDCRICAMGMDGAQGIYHIEDSTDCITIQDVQDSIISVCITKQGFVPFVLICKNDIIYIQNESFDGDLHISSENVMIGRDVTNIKEYGDVIIEKGDIQINGNVEIKNSFEVKKGATLTISPN